MGNVHRFQGRLLSYPNKPTVQEIPTFSCSRSNLPIQSFMVQSVYCCYGDHNHYGCQGSQTDGSKQRYKNALIPRLLVDQSHIPPNLSPTYTVFSSYVSETRLDSKYGEIRAGTRADIRFCRLPVRPHGGQGQTHSGRWQTKKFRSFSPTLPVGSDSSCL